MNLLIDVVFVGRDMNYCSYGCGRAAEYFFKNGKCCCEKYTAQCPAIRKINSEKNTGVNNGMYDKKHSEETKKKIAKKSKEKIFSEEYREKLKQNMKGNQRRKGIKHTKEYKERMSKIRKGVPLSEKNKLGISKALKGRKFTKEWRKKLSKTRKKKFKDPTFLKSFRESLQQKPTKIEIIIHKIVCCHNFIYVGDFKEWVGGKNPDFINKEDKKIIEVFGNYWHNKEDEYIRYKHFKKYGYRLLVIWENEIYNDIENVKKRIIKFSNK